MSVTKNPQQQEGPTQVSARADTWVRPYGVDAYVRRRPESRTGTAQSGKRAPQEPAWPQREPEGQREGRRLGLRSWPLSRHALQGAVDEAAGDGGRDSSVHQGTRRG